MAIPKIIYLILSLGFIFFIYLLFTQPQNALHYAEVFFRAIFKLISALFLGIYRVLEALTRAIASLFKRRR